MTIAFDWDEKQQNKLTKKKVIIMFNFLDKYLTKTINKFCYYLNHLLFPTLAEPRRLGILAFFPTWAEAGWLESWWLGYP